MSDIRRFLIRTGIFLLIFFLPVCIELFVLPIDFFNFRVWEAVKVTEKYRTCFPGPFYPDKRISKVEEGDLAHHTDFAVERAVIWKTDPYGFRQSSTADSADIVLVGFSNVAGCGNSQEDMLAAQLEKMTGYSVYTYAPSDFSGFIPDRRFQKRKPKLVILAAVERNLINLPPITAKVPSFWDSDFRIRWYRSPLYRRAVELLDRISKKNMHHYLKARLFGSVRLRVPSLSDSIFFLHGDSANRRVSESTIMETAEKIAAYRQYFASRGIRFLFAPVPNKETIYYSLLPSRMSSTFLERLCQETRRRDVATVEMKQDFDSVFMSEGPVLYYADDTHWTPRGVEIASRLISGKIAEDGSM